MTYSITQNGKPLDKAKYNIDEKTKTFSTSENSLVLDFNNETRWTFRTGSWCTFKTGRGCTFKTGWGCTFNTGEECIFDIKENCMVSYWHDYKKLKFIKDISLRDRESGTSRTLTEKEQLVEAL